MPYESSDANKFTRKANTAGRSRQWKAVYESCIARGDDEGTAITKANGVAKKSWEGSNPARRKPRDYRPTEMKTAAYLQGPVVKAPKIGAAPKPVSPTPRNDSKIVKAPEVKMAALDFAAAALRSISEEAAEIEKTALRMTARARRSRLLKAKKIPTVKASDVSEGRKRMVAEARRMRREGGKSPVVSRKKLLRKHTRKGGRHEDIMRSFEASRTFSSPTQDRPGTRTVQFKDKVTGVKKSPSAAKASRKPSGSK